jgi:outer membrane receptor protein involved in Fe transport
MDRQIHVNTAFYYYKYDGLQVGVNEATQGTGIPLLRTNNAGSAKVYGVDFDVTYRPASIEGLAFNGAVNWNHARFTSFRGAPCYGGQTIAEGCNLLPAPVDATDPFPAISFSDPAVFGGAPSRYTSQDLKGLPLTRAPDWQVNLGFTYEMPVARGMKLTFGGNGLYTSKLLTNLGPRADFYQRAYAKLNANLALAGEDDRWEIALNVNNLTNKYTTANCTNLNYAGANLPGVVSGAPTKAPGGSDELHCTFDPGREIWLRLTLRP